MQRPAFLLLATLLGCQTGVHVAVDAAGTVDGGDATDAEFGDLAGVRAAPPSFGPTVSLADPPPPLSGGTLVLSRSGARALASDPDRDRVLLADLAAGKLLAEVTLRAHDEPGRAVEDGAGNFHVVLRGAGEIADVDGAGRLTARRAVCPAPRGIAFVARTGNLVVGCATGEVVTIAAAGGAPSQVVFVERDLRDVVVDDRSGALYVTSLRMPALLEIDDLARVKSRRSPFAAGDIPTVAFRTIARPGGGIVMAHQQSRSRIISTQEAGYGDGSLCVGAPRGTIVAAAVTRFEGGLTDPYGHTAILPGVVLPVDVAATEDFHYAVVSAGSARLPGMPQVITADSFFEKRPCAAVPDPRPLVGQAVALAFDAEANLYVQTREPAAIVLYDGPRLASAAPKTIALGGAPRSDTGWEIFHSDSSGGIACASCHPEGGDDGRTWFFDFGPRRTQWLRGKIVDRPPYHWNGDVTDLNELIDNVFALRMVGPRLDAVQLGALAAWLNTLPSLPAPATLDAAAIARGRALFTDPIVGCSGCHSGPQLTNLDVADVGREMPFKVPSLIDVADHPPFLHDGCARTLADRFRPDCGGAGHGHTDQLSPTQLGDLIKYLESL